ncbi:hypothetical protein RDWZM_010219 [Blomia tropicalis]|uniref:Uncharacterized protein n=1 Tax=Blomia tropicalis TaxID=40697 RepID=A0A9Q0LYN9_BLOTA|nr:hypothetical protein RDWZM_010219 [Blomia tropicalis]
MSATILPSWSTIILFFVISNITDPVETAEQSNKTINFNNTLDQMKADESGRSYYMKKFPKTSVTNGFYQKYQLPYEEQKMDLTERYSGDDDARDLAKIVNKYRENGEMNNNNGGSGGGDSVDDDDSHYSMGYNFYDGKRKELDHNQYKYHSGTNHKSKDGITTSKIILRNSNHEQHVNIDEPSKLLINR